MSVQGVMLRLLCVFAHPDDESLGTGGTLAKYSSEGVETFVVTATRGERGRFGTVEPRPGLDVVGKAREAELRAAASVLGVREVSFLNYVDGDLDQAPPGEAIARIVWHIRRIRPHVVITFAPDGGYGHPDHIAISQFAAAAAVAAANPSSPAEPPPDAPAPGSPAPPHAVSKFYFVAWDEMLWARYQAAFKSLGMTVDGVHRQSVPWQSWMTTTELDTTRHWQTVWKAVQCHQTQIASYAKLSELSDEEHRALWGRQTYYRAFSTVNGGRARETDLFEGLRSA